MAAEWEVVQEDSVRKTERMRVDNGWLWLVSAKSADALDVVLKQLLTFQADHPDSPGPPFGGGPPGGGPPWSVSTCLMLH